MDHNKTVCNTRTRCQGKTLIEKEDSSVCLVNNVCACVCGYVCVRERDFFNCRVVEFSVNGIEEEELLGISYVWEEIHSQIKLK